MQIMRYCCCITGQTVNSWDVLILLLFSSKCLPRMLNAIIAPRATAFMYVDTCIRHCGAVWCLPTQVPWLLAIRGSVCINFECAYSRGRLWHDRCDIHILHWCHIAVGTNFASGRVGLWYDVRKRCRARTFTFTFTRSSALGWRCACTMWIITFRKFSVTIFPSRPYGSP